MLASAVSLGLRGCNRSGERKPLLREASHCEPLGWDSVLWEVSEPSHSRVVPSEAAATPCSYVALG